MATTGPIPLYTNPPPNPQYYQPWKFNISAITLGVTTIVTLVIPAITKLNISLGQQVRFIIPPTYGTRELNEMTGYVIGISLPNQVTVNINSTGLTPFVNSGQPTPPQLLSIGDVNSGAINANGGESFQTFINGSFINIGPN